MNKLLVVVAVIIVALVIFMRRGGKEMYVDDVCECHNYRKWGNGGFCFKHDVRGRYLENPRFPCRNHGKCRCWEKHTMYSGRDHQCHHPGNLYGTRPPCDKLPGNI